MSEQLGMTVKKGNFSEWFSEICQKAELSDLRYNVKGFVVFRPWSVQTMKKMYNLFEEELEKKGHLPAFFPALIPESNFKKEAEHVKGFLPQVFWVTEAGSEGKNLEERLALRPTSETAMYSMYSLWIRSWRDLPLKIYQSCQVWRFEGKATRPFIRSREFYWIEAHDVFSTQEEAEKQVKEDMETTENVMHKEFGIPFLFFKRPDHDKFAGAVHTYAADALMPDGKVIQLPSTHLLGQNFSKPFEIKFMDEDGKEKYAWQTCYGPAISRIFAAVVGIHGDDKGLIIPPRIAPIQVIIIPIFTEKDKKKILLKSEDVKKNLEKSGISVRIDEREGYTPGWKFNDWELKGVPVRLEIGPEDIKKKEIVLVGRDNGRKKRVKERELVKSIQLMLDDIQTSLTKKADTSLKKNLFKTDNIKDLKKVLEEKGGLVRINWCGDEGCADWIKAETNGGEIRGTLFGEDEKPDGKCIWCKKKAKEVVYVAKAY